MSRKDQEVPYSDDHVFFYSNRSNVVSPDSITDRHYQGQAVTRNDLPHNRGGAEEDVSLRIRLARSSQRRQPVPSRPRMPNAGHRSRQSRRVRYSNELNPNSRPPPQKPNMSNYSSDEDTPKHQPIEIIESDNPFCVPETVVRVRDGHKIVERQTFCQIKPKRQPIPSRPAHIQRSHHNSNTISVVNNNPSTIDSMTDYSNMEKPDPGYSSMPSIPQSPPVNQSVVIPQSPQSQLTSYGPNIPESPPPTSAEPNRRSPPISPRYQQRSSYFKPDPRRRQTTPNNTPNRGPNRSHRGHRGRSRHRRLPPNPLLSRSKDTRGKRGNKSNTSNKTSNDSSNNSSINDNQVKDNYLSQLDNVKTVVNKLIEDYPGKSEQIYTEINSIIDKISPVSTHDTQSTQTSDDINNDHTNKDESEVVTDTSEIEDVTEDDNDVDNNQEPSVNNQSFTFSVHTPQFTLDDYKKAAAEIKNKNITQTPLPITDEEGELNKSITKLENDSDIPDDVVPTVEDEQQTPSSDHEINDDDQELIEETGLSVSNSNSSSALVVTTVNDDSLQTDSNKQTGLTIIAKPVIAPILPITSTLTMKEIELSWKHIPGVIHGTMTNNNIKIKCPVGCQLPLTIIPNGDLPSLPEDVEFTLIDSSDEPIQCVAVGLVNNGMIDIDLYLNEMDGDAEYDIDEFTFPLTLEWNRVVS